MKAVTRAMIAMAAMVLPTTAFAQSADTGAFTYDGGLKEASGLGAVARTARVKASGEFSPSDAKGSSPANSPSSPVPTYQYLDFSCLARSQGRGGVVISLIDPVCGVPKGKPAPDPGDVERPPSPLELAWFAADRAMSVAEWPDLRIAPKRVGLTGLRSFFWLDHAPRPVTANASVPGLLVTAWAEPIRYEWDLGGASRRTSHSGRPWTRRRSGNIGRMFQRRGSYDIAVEVIWHAQWRIGEGPWRHLGYFSNGDSQIYRVRQMVPMLTRDRD